ncbi:uncharacterized protein LOC143264124 isoform X2 [Megachile rotundata]|uniref:uncharacterized protein LOC143264124 isoform X2 n=1 Tax=Megachile rotundata TaxID=143995 RepID=UPI003FD37F08
MRTVDAFAKFVWLYATRSTSAVEAIDRLKKQATIFGNPRKIISDCGTAFTSVEFQEYCREENIESGLITTDMRIKDNPEVREIINDEWNKMFQEKRDEFRQHAKSNILKLQQENRRNFNRHRKKAHQYQEGDLVAIKRTQSGPGLKFAHKYLGPYRIIRALRNDRYVIEKIGEHEGPKQTSTAAENMKSWIEGIYCPIMKIYLISEDRYRCRMAECGVCVCVYYVIV